MFHPSELHPGRDTWNSQPNGGPNRGQWGPVTDRTWSPSSRVQQSILLVHLYHVGFRSSEDSNVCGKRVLPLETRGNENPLTTPKTRFLRGDTDYRCTPGTTRTSPTMATPPPSAAPPTHSRTGLEPTAGTGLPQVLQGNPYAPWREDDNHPRYCGPPSSLPLHHQRGRAGEMGPSQTVTASTPGRIVNHRAGMWKRPDVPQHHRDQFPQHHRDQFPQHHRDQFPQHHRDQFPQHHAPPAPRDDCLPNGDAATALNRKPPSCDTADRASTTANHPVRPSGAPPSPPRHTHHRPASTAPSGTGGSGGGIGRTTHHGRRAKGDHSKPLSSSPAEHTRVPYGHHHHHPPHHHLHPRHTSQLRTPPHSPPPRTYWADPRGHDYKQSTEDDIHTPVRCKSRNPGSTESSAADLSTPPSLHCTSREGRPPAALTPSGSPTPSPRPRGEWEKRRSRSCHHTPMQKTTYDHPEKSRIRHLRPWFFVRSLSDGLHREVRGHV
ncbi:hypothetical protein N1851_004814 [Merluccius polli]|uniref:Uncharacterized protein n=1 Tax=Merluccius polli TaxID=89951 RepID=A0AA47P7A0_MERPO|nr:hypothetical protein N1851_004814 [Merluccius polli]